MKTMKRARLNFLLAGAFLVSALAPGAARAGDVARTAEVTVLVTIPTRVGVQWSRDVSFDLAAGTQRGSCGTYPPAPATAFPCYWGDEAGVGAMGISLFSNARGAGSVVQAQITAPAGTFGASNATASNILFGSGALADCPAGASTASCVGLGYAVLAAGTPLSFASAAAPTPGWTAVAGGRKFLFQVTNNLTPTGGSSGRATTISVTLP
jgi:hypothetical protein